MIPSSEQLTERLHSYGPATMREICAHFREDDDDVRELRRKVELELVSLNRTGRVTRIYDPTGHSANAMWMLSGDERPQPKLLRDDDEAALNRLLTAIDDLDLDWVFGQGDEDEELGTITVQADASIWRRIHETAQALE